MTDLDLKAILSGDASSFNAAVNSAVEVTEKFRDWQEKAAQVGQQFEESLKKQGITIEEWATAAKHAAEQGENLHGVTGELAGMLGNFGAVGQQAAEILEAIGDAGAVAALAVKFVADAIAETASFGNELANLSAKTGLSVDTLAEWSESASVFGVSANTVAMSVDRLAARVEMGNKQAIEGLRELGLTTNEFLSMNQQDRYAVIIDGLTGIEEAGHKATVATELFSRGGLQMLPALTVEAEEYRAKIADIGGSMEETAEAGRKWKEEVGLLSAEFAKLQRDVALPLMELFTGETQVQKAFMQWEQGFESRWPKYMEFINWLRELGNGGMPSFGDVKGGSTTTADQYFEENEKADNAQAKAEEYNQKYDEAQARKAAAADKLHERLLKQQADEEEAANAAAEKWIENEVRKEQQADDAAAKWLVNEQKKEIAAEIFAANDDARAKKESEALDTQFAQQFLDGLEKDRKKATELRDAIGSIAGALAGLVGGGALGDLLTGLAQGAQYADQIKQALDSGNKAGAIAAGVGAAVGIFTDAKGDGKVESKGQAALGGALHGAATGAMIGSVVPGIGTAVGAVVGGVIGIIGGLFHDNPEWSKVGEEVGKDWGVHITDALAKQIEATESSAHVGRAMAELLNLDDIMDQSGEDPSQFGDKINNLMEAVSSGAVPAADGIKQLGKAFDDLKTAADGGSVASEAAMVKMIQRARELGEHIPELDAAVSQMLDDALKGLDQFYKGMSPGAGGKKQGEASQSLFGAVYQASVGQSGLAETFAKFQQTFDDMRKSMAPGTKLTGASAEFAQLEKLMKNKEFAGAATGAEGLAQTTKGLLDSGNMSQQIVNALSKSTQTLYDQALSGAQKAGVKGDKADKAAMQAILPELIELQHAQSMGAKLTPQETALLAKANADGMLPMKTIQEQQLDTLHQIAANTGGGAGAGGAPGGPGAAGRGYQAAAGFFHPSMPAGPLPGGGTALTVHPGERVSVSQGGSGGWARGQGASNITLAPVLQVGTLIGSPDDVIDMVTAALNAGHPEITAAIQRASWNG